jgi:hypothetical protein
VKWVLEISITSVSCRERNVISSSIRCVNPLAFHRVFEEISHYWSLLRTDVRRFSMVLTSSKSPFIMFFNPCMIFGQGQLFVRKIHLAKCIDLFDLCKWIIYFGTEGGYILF